MKLVIPARPNHSYSSSPFFNLSQELDRLFASSNATPARGATPAAFAPALELRENQDTYQVSVELPGVERKDVEVTLHEGVLTISGERKPEAEVKEGEFVQTERAYGRFQRQVALPQTVNAETVKAAHKDGVLTVTLPKTIEAKPKQIVINPI